jgi:uncharacterized protein with HEPN domain
VKDPRVYLVHVQECIARIERHTAADREAFLVSDLAQDAVLRNLQTIGQPISRFPEDLKYRHPEIDWRSIVGFLNVLVHDYLGINVIRVWEIVERDLPALKRAVEAMLRETDPAR